MEEHQRRVQGRPWLGCDRLDLLPRIKLTILVDNTMWDYCAYFWTTHTLDAIWTPLLCHTFTIAVRGKHRTINNETATTASEKGGACAHALRISNTTASTSILSKSASLARVVTTTNHECAEKPPIQGILPTRGGEVRPSRWFCLYASVFKIYGAPTTETLKKSSITASLSFTCTFTHNTIYFVNTFTFTTHCPGRCGV